MIQKLNAMFNKRYGQQLADLNVNVYKSAVLDDGCFEVPTVSLGGGGGTILNSTGVASLNPPALVRIINKKMKPYIIVYRVAIPFEEAEIASNKPEYFNYLFDALVSKALGNYKVTVGAEDKVRFGNYYISASSESSPGEVFRMLHTPDGIDLVEFRFTGSWAGDEEVL